MTQCQIDPNDILSFVNLERYPVHTLESRVGQVFIAQCQAHMRDVGWCSFDNFIRPEGVKYLTREANQLLPEAEKLTIKRNIYGGAANISANQDHLENRELIHHTLQLANDQIPTDSLVSRLYLSDYMTDFIRQIQGKEELYRSADMFQALNIVALEPGGWHGWHYDHDECVVTLLLQGAEKGGEFTFLPNSRNPDGTDKPQVARFMNGDMSVATTIGRDAGTLTVFRGEYSLHGVSKIEGEKPRITAIFTYDHIPNRVSSDDVNIRIYGERARKIIRSR